MAFNLLMSNWWRSVIIQYLKRKFNVILLFRHSFSTHGFTIISIKFQSMLHILGHLNAKIVGFIQIASIPPLHQRVNLLTFLQNILNPIIECCLMVNALCHWKFSGLYRMVLLQVGQGPPGGWSILPLKIELPYLCGITYGLPVTCAHNILVCQWQSRFRTSKIKLWDKKHILVALRITLRINILWDYIECQLTELTIIKLYLILARIQNLNIVRPSNRVFLVVSILSNHTSPRHVTTSWKHYFSMQETPPLL